MLKRRCQASGPGSKFLVALIASLRAPPLFVQVREGVDPCAANLTSQQGSITGALYINYICCGGGGAASNQLYFTLLYGQMEPGLLHQAAPPAAVRRPRTGHQKAINSRIALRLLLLLLLCFACPTQPWRQPAAR